MAVPAVAVLATALTAAAGPAGQANAAPAVVPEISLDLDRCSTLPRAEIIRLVGLELDARVLSPGNGGPHATRGAIACGPAGVRLEVSDPLAGKFLSRALPSVSRDADAASRIVALALAELVFTSWAELAQQRTSTSASPALGDAPPPELRRAAMERAQRHAGAPAMPAAPAPPPEVAPAPRPPVTPPAAAPVTTAAPVATATSAAASTDGPDGAYILAVGEATGPFDGVGLAWGAGARLGWTSGTPLFALSSSAAGFHLGADLDLTAAWTDVDSALGSVRVSTWSAAPRASLKLYLDDDRGAWLDIGAGARIGVARLVGAPTDATSVRGGSLAGTWGGAAAYAGIGVTLGSVVVAAGLEGGHVLRTVSGMIDGERSVAISGQWLSGSLALGWGR